MGGGGSTNTIQKADPWEPSQGYLKEAMQDAERLYKSGGFSPTPFAGDRTANPSGATQAAERQIYSHAIHGTPLVDKAHGALGGVMATGIPQMTTDAITRAMNPANDNRFDDTIDRMTGTGYSSELTDALRANVAGSVMPGVNATFSNSGMAGGTGHMDTLTRSMTEAMAPIEAGLIDSAENRAMSAAMAGQGAHENSMARALGAGQLASTAQDTVSGRQIQGSALAPTLESARYLDDQMMANLGAVQDGRKQADINANMAQHYEAQNQSADNLMKYTGALLGYGGQGGSTTQSGGGASGFSRGLGGAMSGLGMYGSLANAGLVGAGATGALAGLGPWGLAAGGLLGGLFS